MPKIIALVENTSVSKEYRNIHGLSLYIETEKHRILFDVGPDDTFAYNARRMGIDLSLVDTVVISHGHFDHGGGLKKLLEINQSAKIYVQKKAFDPHYIKVLGFAVNIGLDKKLLSSNRFVFTDDIAVIDDELTLFSGVSTELYPTASNRAMYIKNQKRLVNDDFGHEQNLIIRSGEKHTLVCGCAHAGIINILDKARSITSCEISAVIGGFHLYNPPTGKYESDEFINSIAMELSVRESQYYTGHCTGAKAFELMKASLGDRLNYLATGCKIDL